VIRLEGVRKRYRGADIDVLSGIDLTIEASDFVSIVGRSGSGKTTLLNLIGTFDPVQMPSSPNFATGWSATSSRPTTSSIT
jgi:ABC-type lipoprotein export system ATPase subunit